MNQDNPIMLVVAARDASANCYPHPQPLPTRGSSRNWLVIMGFRTAAVGGDTDTTASELCLAYSLALRQLHNGLPRHPANSSPRFML